MRFMLILLFSFTLQFTNCSAQDSLRKEVSIQFAMTRMDFFAGLVYSRQYQNWKPFVHAEIGVNRTIFQKRFFPRINVGSAYFFINKEKLRLGPQLTYAHSVLKINKNSEHFHQWNEIYLGSKLEVGSKIRFTNVISGGWMNERYYNQLFNKKDGVNSFGFYVNIGLSYVW